jgi:hypothetical protein
LVSEGREQPEEVWLFLVHPFGESGRNTSDMMSDMLLSNPRARSIFRYG